ncbi:PAN domain-containing protein [Bradyrhizobium sp. Ce-3]|uniref:PAN domain-containing protein n=1 Tax=Bradyrhizobium sp. Ce-3 TaxID=2913970 RepID=UPI001FBA3135|nr:PAN domain-containing protein [Bradyrhizobium sp. Ce-3]
MSDPAIVSGFETTTLDLYDQPLSFSETVDKIIAFIRNTFDDVIVYYCGHGDLGLRSDDYRVLLRTSDRTLRATLLEIALLIHDVARLAQDKRVYFVLDACYSGSAMGESEQMDAGGAEAIVNKRLSDAVIEAGSGIAVFAASGRHGVALAKRDDKFTLFTGTFLRVLKDGILTKADVKRFSWLDLKDEIVRLTQKRLKGQAPIPKLSRFTEHVSDITRAEFFPNCAYAPRADAGGGGSPWGQPDPLVSEHLYWRGIKEDQPANVFEDFLRQFPNGTFVALARAILTKKIDGYDEEALEGHLLEHPQSAVAEHVNRRLAWLQWERLKSSTDIPELERFIERFAQSPTAALAKAQVEAIRSKEKVEPSPEPVTEPPKPAPQVPKSSIRSLASQPLVILGVLACLGLAFFAWRSHLGPGLEALQADLDAAGSDVARLQGFIGRCEAAPGCTLVQEARSRLARAQEQARLVTLAAARTALDAAGSDPGKLRAFVQQCAVTSCPVAAEANARLAKAEENARLAKAEEARRQRVALDAAGNDPAKLRAFLQQCGASSCALAGETTSRLQAAEARAHADQDRKDLDGAGTDVAKLRSFVDRCRATSCPLLQEANGRLEAAQNAEVARQRAEQLRTFSLNANSDVRGGDFLDAKGDAIFERTDAAGCLAACRANSACVGFSYDRWNGLCFQKKTLSPLRFDARSDTSIRADQVHPGFSPDGKHLCPFSGNSLAGDVLKRLPVQSVAQCEQNCTPDSCIAFSFSKADKSCSLFRMVSNRWKNVPNVDSGIMQQDACH